MEVVMNQGNQDKQQQDKQQQGGQPKPNVRPGDERSDGNQDKQQQGEKQLDPDSANAQRGK
jgi:hypothetical protein